MSRPTKPVVLNVEDTKNVDGVKIGVKRERSDSTERAQSAPATSASSAPPPCDVYKKLSTRMGGNTTPCSLDAASKAGLIFADVVPYMWKEKPLDATMKLILEQAVEKGINEPLILSLNAQVEQLNRRFTLMWNDCVFSGLSADETAEKLSLDPQAWLISEAAMEIILQVCYPTLKPAEVQETLKKYRSMMPLEMLLNPVTGKQHWEKVAFLMKEHWDLHIKYVTSEKDVQVAGNDYDELHKQYCDLHKVYTSLKAKNASQAETEKLLRSIIAQCGTTSVYNGRNCGTSIVKCYEHSSYKK